MMRSAILNSEKLNISYSCDSIEIYWRSDMDIREEHRSAGLPEWLASEKLLQYFNYGILSRAFCCGKDLQW